MSLNSPHDISTISLLLTMHYSYYSFNIPSIPVISPIWGGGGEGGCPAAADHYLLLSQLKKTDVESLQVHVMVMPFLLFWDLKTKNIDFVGREQWPE